VQVDARWKTTELRRRTARLRIPQQLSGTREPALSRDPRAEDHLVSASISCPSSRKLILYRSLVNPEFPPEFREFMASNGIRHCIVEMQGTKRVEIPDIVMNSIMEIALNKENHPLLIHCNHGKVLTPFSPQVATADLYPE
jgi:hypothetical protein